MSAPSYDRIERVALAFVLEDDTWAGFLAWALEQADSAEMEAWAMWAQMDGGAVLAGLRSSWLAHSPDPDVRALADPA